MNRQSAIPRCFDGSGRTVRSARRPGIDYSSLGRLTAAIVLFVLVSMPFALAQSQPQGTLEIAMPGDFGTLDPHRTATAIERGLVGTVFSGLIYLDQEGIPQGDLAESWEIPDELTYVFTLRDNAYFHDGSKVTAEDVKFSLERVKSLEGSSRWAGMISDIDEVEVLDERTVRLTLNQPSAPLLHNLGYISIVSEDSADTLSTQPIGSGPFVFEEWIPNNRMRLSANPDFYFPGQPAVERLDWIPMEEPATMVANLQTGDVDVASALEFAAVPQLEGAANVTLVTPDVPTSYGAIFFRNEPPFDNLQLRLAIAHAVNRDAINRAVYFGLGDADCNPYPRGHWAYEELDCLEYDLDVAREYLSEAGYEDGLEVTWKMLSFPYAVKTAEIVAESLAQIGVDVRLIPLDISTFVQEVYVDREFQIASGAFVREFDPDAVIESVVRTGGGNNPGEYSNPQVDELLRRGRAELDRERRQEIYAELAQLITDDVAVIKTSTHPYVWAVRSNVDGLWLDSIGTANVALRTVSVEE